MVTNDGLRLTAADEGVVAEQRFARQSATLAGDTRAPASPAQPGLACIESAAAQLLSTRTRIERPLAEGSFVRLREKGAGAVGPVPALGWIRCPDDPFEGGQVDTSTADEDVACPAGLPQPAMPSSLHGSGSGQRMACPGDASMKKEDSRTLPLDALNALRRRAVQLRLDGTSLKDTAARCGLSRTTVIAALKAYHAGGWAAVDVERGGRPVGSGRALDAGQERELRRLIGQCTPDQLSQADALWSRQAVSDCIAARYGIRLAVRTLGLYLQRWGYVAPAADASALVAGWQWRDEHYPVVAALARSEGADIRWFGTTVLRGNDPLHRADLAHGDAPVAGPAGDHDAATLVFAMSNKGEMLWKVIEGELDADALLDFLHRLSEGAGRKLFLMVEPLQVHQDQAVRAWLAEHSHQIVVFFLPGGGPD